MDITITKADGTKEPFNADKINKSIERTCRGLTDPVNKVMQIASDTKLTLYDGITTAELDEATIQAALQNIKDDIEYDKIATRLYLKTIYRSVLGDCDWDDRVRLEELHRDGFVSYIETGVDQGLLDERMRDRFDLRALAGALKIERDELFKYSGLSTLMNRYAIKAGGKKPLETPQYFFMRVAMGLSYNEDDPTAQAALFYNRMSQLKYLAGGSCNIGAGTCRPSLSNCFLLEIHDNIEHISKSVADVIKLSKATGGIGASITKLRAAGSPLSSNNTFSSGPTPFAKIVDTAIRAVSRGGKKKGALCFYMENWHIDFPEFVDWKHNAGDDYLRMRTANTAVYLSDEFMRRVQEGESWYMFDPKETPDLNELYGAEFRKRYQHYIEQAEQGNMRVFKKVPAREQYRQILVSLQTTSHPWLTWKDTINLRALNNNTGTIHMSNLCTEITLPQDEENIAVCNLCSINLAQHLNEASDDVDWEALEQTVRLAVRHLDNLIDINELPIPEATKSDRENRAVGLGVMGFADAVEQLGLAYDDEETYTLADKVFEFISYAAIDTSADLAQERGSYKHFAGSGWSKGMVPIDTMERLRKQRGMDISVDQESKGAIDWNMLREKVQNGMRNATLMAVAPNANIGLVGGTTPGVDPRFAQVFSRNKISGKYLDINHNLVNELKQLGIWDRVKDYIIEYQGDISQIGLIPDYVKHIYKTAFTTSPYAYVEVAARAQKWLDQSMSRNMYLETRDIDETMDIYMTAWAKGLKTTYYLHMKPRHTAEQSTVTVNKREQIGKMGFAALRAHKESSAAHTATEIRDIEEREKVPVPVPKNKKTEEAEQLAQTCPVDPQERHQCDSCQ